MKKTPATFHTLKPFMELFQTGVPVLMYHKIAEPPAGVRLKSRKHWIAFALRPEGSLAVDKGAADALRNRGRSLLPSGVREVRGDFGGGDCVSLLDPDGVEFGRGLVNYPASDVLKVAGRRSTEIPTLLGYKVADEIIHRDNFVLMKEIA